MLEVVPYELDDIKNELKRKAIDILGITDAEFEGSNVSQLINLLAYANVINNTNFTFGLNEMFITQAQDRRNVIKHARQMGYTHVRKKSYQYKIKLKSIKSGTLTMEKYTNFTSNGHNYVYMGDSITDVYGTYVYLKLLVNENNNKQVDLFNQPSTAKGQYAISEEGQVCYIHEKDTGTTNRLLLESIDDSEIPMYSQLPQEVWVWDTNHNGTDGPAYAGYRYFTKVGNVDTFLYDSTNKIFKIQISLDETGEFPIFTVVEETRTLSSNGDGTLSFDTDLTNAIKYFNEIILDPDGTPETLSLYEFDFQEGDFNASITANEVPAEESHVPSNVTNDVEFNATLTTNRDIIPGSVGIADIKFSDGRIRKIMPEDLTVSGNDITIPFQVTSTRDNEITVSGASVQLTNINIKNVTNVVVKEGADNFIIKNYSWNNTTGVLTILNNNNLEDTQYDTKLVDIDYEYFEDLTNITDVTDITLRYSYQDNSLTGKTVKIKYSYDIGADGYLDKRFFFSDLRGEYADNEKTVAADPTFGFDGFYASDFNSESSVLTFRVDVENVGGNTIKHNQYVKTKENGVWKEALQLHEVLTTPFRKTRFAPTTRHEDVEGNVTYDPFDPAYCFASVSSLEAKDELEIIVKEGTIKRYNDVDATNNTLYPELTIKATEDIVEAGHFIIEGADIENNGIEMFITRVLESGIIETDEPWAQREYLLAENTGANEKTFVVLPDLNYENYINIYTKYAGTGIDLSLDFIFKINLLTSSGSAGKTSDLIKPVNSEDFEAIYYIESTLTPHVLYIEGSDEETTESIRQNAPLFSNTANRAVTKNDYLTITQAQGFVDKAEIWGGEENTPVTNPGHVYITLVPYSRPLYFKSENNGTRFYLDQIDNTSLFFPTYYQVTGKESYNTVQTALAKADTNVLFNILDSYKIITIQTNYVKSIYMDYTLNIKVLKYKFGQTVEETNTEIFAAIEKFFKNNIESYNAEYFNSTVIKHIDSVIGDRFGIQFSTSFGVDLYDNYYLPDTGTFFNEQKGNLVPDAQGNVGWNDRWVFEMPLDMPIEDMFEPDLVVDHVVTEYGGMIVGNITNCNTPDFLIPGDLLYMMLDDGTFVSINNDGEIETIKANSLSNEISISVMYTRNSSVVDPAVGDYAEHFKVGEYIIYKKQNVIILRIYTHKYFNIDEKEQLFIITDGELKLDNINGYVNNFGEWVKYNASGEPSKTGAYLSDGTLISEWEPRYLIDVEPDTNLMADYLEDEDSNTWIFNESYKTNDYYTKANPLGYENIQKEIDGEPFIAIREVPLPRLPFTQDVVTLNINAKNENIKSRRNVFSRLKEVNFI